MVFSRYAIIVSGKTLRSQCLFRANEMIDNAMLHCRKTKIVRFYGSQDREGVENLSITKNQRMESAMFREDLKNLSKNISHLTSQAATQFVSTGITENSCIDKFSEKPFTSRDSTLESYLNEDFEEPSALDKCDEDLSYLSPYRRPTFNFASYANDSPLIQQLARLGVDFYRVEKRPKAMEILLQKTFDEMKPYIQFLHDCGVTADDIGAFITRNPYIFGQDINNMLTRIRYLRAHEFDRDAIARIVNKNTHWLMYSTRNIDTRLGYFQQEFNLDGADTRYLVTKQPRLITYNLEHIKQNIFAIREEMGFDKDETKAILLHKPRLFMKSRRRIVEAFDYAHNTMKLPHEIIKQQPQILTCRIERLCQRHKYLETVGKIQYDPTKPMYVSPVALISGTDRDFCRNVAKTTLETYNLYLKTL